jgi:CIC family chloride channel protein
MATSCTLGSGGSGGVFAPSLFMGAMAGALVGQGSEAILGPLAGSPGGYALVGMGGVVAGTTHAPIAAILIIFEITNNYSIILPLMTVCIISLLLSSRLSTESIYTMKLVRRGINIFKKKSLNFLQDYQVKERMRDDFETVRTDETVNSLIDRMLQTERSHFYVIEESGRLHGLLDLDDLGRVLSQHEGLEHVLLAEDLAEEGINTLLPTDTLGTAMMKFEKSGTSELPVLNDPVEKRMVGILRYNEMVAIYNRQMMDHDTAANLAERFTTLGPAQRVRLMEDFSLLEWDPPQFMWDRSLMEVNLPGRYGIHVILIKKFSTEKGHEGIIPVVPSKDTIISSHDTFVIYGKDEHLERVKHL